LFFFRFELKDYESCFSAADDRGKMRAIQNFRKKAFPGFFACPDRAH